MVPRCQDHAPGPFSAMCGPGDLPVGPATFWAELGLLDWPTELAGTPAGEAPPRSCPGRSRFSCGWVGSARPWPPPLSQHEDGAKPCQGHEAWSAKVSEEPQGRHCPSKSLPARHPANLPPPPPPYALAPSASPFVSSVECGSSSPSFCTAAQRQARVHTGPRHAPRGTRHGAWVHRGHGAHPEERPPRGPGTSTHSHGPKPFATSRTLIT